MLGLHHWFDIGNLGGASVAWLQEQSITLSRNTSILGHLENYFNFTVLTLVTSMISAENMLYC